MTPQEKHYLHYAKCQLPVKDCLVCRFVVGNLTIEEKIKLKEYLK